MVLSQDYPIQLTHLFQFILKDLCFCESLQRDPEELVLGLRVHDNILKGGKSQNGGKSGKEKQRSNVLTLILVEAEYRSLLSASMSAHYCSVFTMVVINPPIRNPTFIKSGSLAKVSTTCGIR
jgi:hypothetical protein